MNNEILINDELKCGSLMHGEMFLTYRYEDGMIAFYGVELPVDGFMSMLKQIADEVKGD